MHAARSAQAIRCRNLRELMRRRIRSALWGERASPLKLPKKNFSLQKEMCVAWGPETDTRLADWVAQRPCKTWGGPITGIHPSWIPTGDQENPGNLMISFFLVSDSLISPHVSRNSAFATLPSFFFLHAYAPVVHVSVKVQTVGSVSLARPGLMRRHSETGNLTSSIHQLGTTDVSKPKRYIRWAIQVGQPDAAGEPSGFPVARFVSSSP